MGQSIAIQIDAEYCVILNLQKVKEHEDLGERLRKGGLCVCYAMQWTDDDGARTPARNGSPTEHQEL